MLYLATFTKIKKYIGKHFLFCWNISPWNKASIVKSWRQFSRTFSWVSLYSIWWVKCRQLDFWLACQMLQSFFFAPPKFLSSYLLLGFVVGVLTRGLLILHPYPKFLNSFFIQNSDMNSPAKMSLKSFFHLLLLPPKNTFI